MTKWIELRRHSYTKKGEARGQGSHLSRHGVVAARAEGNCIGSVSHVVVSTVPRTMETALAMGFSVDRIADVDSAMVTGEVEFHEWWEWANPFVEFAARMSESPALSEYGARQVWILLEALAAVGKSETALVIGHGGWIEPTLVACMPNADFREWGRAFRHLEGARLAFAGTGFELVSLRRREPAD